MSKNRMFRYLFLLIAFVGFEGCQETPTDADVNIDEFFSTDTVEDGQLNVEAMKVLSVNFSPDRKYFHVYVGFNHDVGPYHFTDSNDVTIKVSESVGGILQEKKTAAKLIGVKNTEGDEVAKRKVKCLALVDLTQPQDVLDKVRDAVKEIQAVFSHKNLFVSFMDGQNVSETIEVTDYVLENYFKSHPEQYCYLYRSILLKKREMEDHLGVWADAKKMGLIVFSDEKVYGDNDEPVDPKHCELQQTLVNSDSLRDERLSVFAVSLGKMVAAADYNEAQSVLKVVCKNTGGLYQDKFGWTEMEDRLLESESMIVANEFIFENPDGKVYRGNPHRLRIEIISNEADSVIGTASTNIFLGTAYNPVIVNDPGTLWMFLQGLGLGLFFIIMVYLIFQFLIPYIKYRLFLKKYVVKYVKGDMSVGNVVVGQTCYFCKAPFMEGDDIVVKCKHVMHKSCWDENDYHCPEFGRHCQSGSHYYNYANLFDSKNASFYMKWILVSIVSAVFTWLFYLLYVTDFHQTPDTLIAQMMEPRIADIGNYAIFNNDENGINQIPEFGLFIGFFLTLALASLAVRRQQMRRRVLDILIRAVVVGVFSYMVFLLFRFIAQSFDMGTFSAIIDWIPWSMMALMVAFGSTIGTRIKLKKYVLAITLVLGIVSMYLWSFLFNDTLFLDIRVLLLVTCIFFAVGLAVSVAEMAPKSERYFLNVKGAMKEMDIALFKWFINNPDQVVTIGKSIDCSLQMSWDIKGQVAPIQAEIRQINGVLRLTAIETGIVINNKPLAVGRSAWLYHNSSFSIGDTTFTYIERDL